nr:MAG TPA: hypothetical protein [Caudoviricetes sp.]
MHLNCGRFDSCRSSFLLHNLYQDDLVLTHIIII